MSTLDRIRTMIADQVGVPLEQVTEASTLTDHGVDSLDLVELTMEIERTFNVVVTDDNMDALQTVADVVCLVDGPRALMVAP